MRRSIWLLATLAVSAASAGLAQAQDAAEPRSAVLQALTGCRAIADNAARLTCYDRESLALDQAEQTGQVVVVDRAQVEQTRREVFGFSLNLPILSRGVQAEEVTSVSGILKSARQGGDGKWVITLEDGAVWRQVDDESLATRPRPGAAVEIRRAALASYMLTVNGGRVLRVRREQ